MAKTMTAAELAALTAAELETLQLAVNAEVAARIQNERLENRLVTALTDAQGVGFTDAQIEAVYAKAREKAQQGYRDPARTRKSGGDKTEAKKFTDEMPTEAALEKQRKAT